MSKFDLHNPLLGLESQALSSSAFNNVSVTRVRKNVARFLANTANAQQIDHCIPYIAMDYFDRFISIHQNLPRLNNMNIDYRWHITATSCFCLASRTMSNNLVNKMLLEYVRVYQNDVQNVEKLVAFVLGNRVNSITAFAFIDYFKSLVGDMNYKTNIEEMLFELQGDIRCTQYTPSVIAASAVLTCHYTQSHCLQQLMAGCVSLDESLVLACAALINDMCKKKLIPLLERIWVVGSSSNYEGIDLDTVALRTKRKLQWTMEVEEKYLTIDASQFSPQPEVAVFEAFSLYGVPSALNSTGSFRLPPETEVDEAGVDQMQHGKAPMIEETNHIATLLNKDVKNIEEASEQEKREETKIKLKWMMGVKQADMRLDPSQFPNGADSETDSDGEEDGILMEAALICLPLITKSL